MIPGFLDPSGGRHSRRMMRRKPALNAFAITFAGRLEGHYVGCNLAVTHFQGTWWGEDDDIISIDGEQWPPSLHGTGGEDCFGHALGMQRNAFAMNSSIIHEDDVPGFQHSYRFHLVDPVRFTRSIKVTMEHGHANHLADDLFSTAYWYQTLPSRPFTILSVERRLPLRARRPPATVAVELTEE